MILMYRFLFGLLELYEQMKQSAQARLGDIRDKTGIPFIFWNMCQSSGSGLSAGIGQL